jgi:ribonucleotide reductase alpha subunit
VVLVRTDDSEEQLANYISTVTDRQYNGDAVARWSAVRYFLDGNQGDFHHENEDDMFLRNAARRHIPEYSILHY